MEITKDMLISEVIEMLGEDAAIVMMEHGLHCVGCHISAFETIEQGTVGHGFSEKDLELLIRDLNKIASEQEANKNTPKKEEGEHGKVQD
ncbi:DUF1858 domain-containing protein [Candidatus Woesearchaeota archaeon]|nr:MAG: DUF1858 domain-containing protein [Candidatus Woesearchaeota archaeon]